MQNNQNETLRVEEWLQKRRKTSTKRRNMTTNRDTKCLQKTQNYLTDTGSDHNVMQRYKKY